MKQFLIALFLLATAMPLFASEEGGDGTTIPDYQELVREGYGPRQHESQRDQEGYLMLEQYGATTAPKPTQAYYGKGYTIYYGYTMVVVPRGQSNAVSAFGYPLEYFRHLMPASAEGLNLSQYALEVRKSVYEPGEFVAQHQTHRSNAVTTAQSVTTTPANGTKSLPAIAEKPAR